MKRTLVFVFVALWMGIGFPLHTAHCETTTRQPPPEGSVLPDIQLPVPQEKKAKEYLGIRDKKLFKIPKIKADVVVIEVFSMYCPYCQKEAPVVNDLYKLISEREDLKNRIKIIGIGASNSSYEVNIFKEKYNIPFPLFPDQDLSLHCSLGEVRTPYFFAIKIHQNGTHKVIYSKLGRFGDPKEFLDLLVKRAKL
jgi:peroxiredoxin